jgi:hypothetical protein
MGYSKTLAGLSSGLDARAPNRVLNRTARSVTAIMSFAEWTKKDYPCRAQSTQLMSASC